MEETLDEYMLEDLYWNFDAERKRGNRSERDIFKEKIIYFTLHVNYPGAKASRASE